MYGVRSEPEEILKLVADYFGLSPDALMAGRRTLLRTWARHCTAFLLRRTGRYSHADVARILHYGDHTAVINAVRRVQRASDAGGVIARQVGQLLDQLSSLEEARYGQTTKG